MAVIKGAGGEEWQHFEDQAGYDPNAWTTTMKAAEARIDGLRRRDAVLQLTDRQGRPLADRAVVVRQTRSDFVWGYGGWRYLAQLQQGSFDHLDNRHRQQADLQLFNALNLMHYWAERHCTNAPQNEEHQGHVDYELVDRAVQWARGHGLRCKGHPIYWPVEKAIPAWLMRYDYDTRLKFLEVRVRQLTARLRGRMDYYDAVNEMMWEPTLRHTEQRHWPHIEPIEAIAEECARVIGWAREEDPEAGYFLNEYGLARGETEPVPVATNTGGSISRDQQLDRFIALARELTARGQEPDGLGIQSPPGDWSQLQRLADTLDAIGEGTGLPVHLTEFRTGVKHLERLELPAAEIDERLAEYEEAVMVTCFGNPHCDALWWWGSHRLFQQGSGNTTGRRPTAVFERLRSLIRDRWMTNETLRTDADGVLRFRGFCGDYSLQLARSSGQTSGYAFRLPAACVGACEQRLRLGLIGAAPV